MKIALIYIIVINIVSAVVFAADKSKAANNKYRIPEKILHLFEFLGGVFSIWVLMYVIRHKNKKFSYFIFTYLALAVWAFVFYRFHQFFI